VLEYDYNREYDGEHYRKSIDVSEREVMAGKVLLFYLDKES
jgi:hypothetical protein